MKNPLLLANILLIGTVLTVLAACTKKSEGGPSIKNLGLYTVEKTNLDATQSVGTGSKLLGVTIDGDKIINDQSRNEVYFQGEDPSVTFAQNLRNGDLSFSRSRTRYTPEFMPQLPSQEESKKIAQDFLLANNLAPARVEEMQVVHAGGLRGAAAGSAQIKDIYRTIHFGRVLDQLPVVGPGSKIVVHVGDKGEILGATRRWQEIVPEKGRKSLKIAEIKNEKEAREEAGKIIAAEFGSNSKFIVNKVQIAYFDQGAAFIQPVYAFETTVTMVVNGKETIVPYLFVTEAMKSSPEPLVIRTLDRGAKEGVTNIRAGATPIDTLKRKQRGDD